jgi:predicted outer membrane lipoprotein
MNSRPMAALPSLRRELVRTLTLVSGVWLLAVFLAMAFGIRHEVDDLMDDALQESAEVLYGTLVLHGYDLAQRTRRHPAGPAA